MVFDTIDDDGLAPQVLQGACHVGMESGPQFRVLEKGHPVLGAEDDVQDNTGKRLRHGGNDCGGWGVYATEGES